MAAGRKTALILGISGQDGAYLARHLLDRDYDVHGASRDAQMSSFGNLRRLGVYEQVTLHSVTLTDFRSVLQTLAFVEPDEVYNLAGQSSVGLSFEQPVETLTSIANGTLNLLETIRFLQRPVRFYNACSTECFGSTSEPATEETPFRPRSPYAVAKAAAFWEVANYREAYGMYACSGILSNHEPPLRPPRFVTQKIIHSACRIASGLQDSLELGNIAIARDWGWSPEYVDAMHRMLQQPEPRDYIVATGETRQLEDFVREAFAAVGLDWKRFVRTSPRLVRPADIPVSRVCPDRAKRELGWTAETTMSGVVRKMVAAWIEEHPGSKCTLH